MNSGALFFLVLCWGLILTGVALSLSTILKNSK